MPIFPKKVNAKKMYNNPYTLTFPQTTPLVCRKTESAPNPNPHPPPPHPTPPPTPTLFNRRRLLRVGD